jgi:hypothetical protein
MGALCGPSSVVLAATFVPKLTKPWLHHQRVVSKSEQRAELASQNCEITMQLAVAANCRWTRTVFLWIQVPAGLSCYEITTDIELFLFFFVQVQGLCLPKITTKSWRWTSKSIWTMVEAVQVLFMWHYVFSFVVLKWCSKVIQPYRQCSVESIGIWSIWYEGHANVSTDDWLKNLSENVMFPPLEWNFTIGLNDLSYIQQQNLSSDF